jgi:hypothetical protein
MLKRPFLFAAVSILTVLLAAAREAPAAPRQAPIRVCSDGTGTVLLFWLPGEGKWPEGGFRLERVSGRKKTVIAQTLRPGQDETAMSAIDPWEAIEIRALEEKIRYGTLTDEERNDSISIMERKASLDVAYGRALGVRYADRVKIAGDIVYRLTALAAGGDPEETVTSSKVNPMRRTPGPERPSGLRAEVRPEGVALFWEEPPGGNDAPVVAYRVARGSTPGRSPALTRKPIVPSPHPGMGEPKFMDADPRRETLLYQVQSVDIFSRTSAPVKVKVDERKLLARSEKPAPEPSAKAESSPQAASPSAETPGRAEAPPPPPPSSTSPPEISSPERSATISAVAPVPAAEPLSRPPDTDLPRDPGEIESLAKYRRAVKDKELGLTVAVPSPPISPANPPEPSPSPAVTDLPRDPEEEARIAMYRKMAEDKELGLTVAVPSPPKSTAAPPETSPRPAVTDLPRDPEEEARIAMYRKMAEDKELGLTVAVPSPPKSTAAPPEPPPSPAVTDLPRDPEEEARIAEYRRMAEDKDREIEQTAAPATTPGGVDKNGSGAEPAGRSTEETSPPRVPDR